MAGTKPIFYGLNLIDTTGVFGAAGAVAGKPITRLYDREIGLFWESTTAADQAVKSDQGSGTRAIDTCVIAAGHNLAGATILFQSSPDNSTYTTRATLSPVVGSGILVLTFSPPLTVRYWAIALSSLGAAPQISELFFTLSVASPRFISENGSRYGLRSGAVILEGSAGKDWGSKRHDPRWFAEYLLREFTQTDREAFEQFYRDVDGGAKPFFVLDADGVKRWVRLVRPELSLAAVPVYRHDFTVELLEQL